MLDKEQGINSQVYQKKLEGKDALHIAEDQQTFVVKTNQVKITNTYLLKLKHVSCFVL